MHAYRPERRLRTSDVTTAVRRVSGPVADELFVLCRPDGPAADAARQAASAYEALWDALAAEGAGPETLVSETVFLRRIRTDLDAVRAERVRVLGSLERCPATTFIGQPPLDPAAHLEVAAVALLPRSGDASWTRAVGRSAECPCEICAAGTHATVVRLSGQLHLHAGNVCGTGRGAYEEAYDMFRVAEALLGEAGMTFGNVMRTWIHLRDIDRDYEAFNRARREFFERRGIERRPASTGIQGVPSSDAHAFSLSLYALKSPTPLDVAPISTPLLNEAWSYGSDFSRGLRIADANKVALHVSGTASIDEAGSTVHVDSFEAQVDRMLHNIASLLERQGATFADLVSGVVYLKNPDAAPALRAILRAHGFDGFPCALVEAPLCRPELLCEAEAVAVLPLARAEA